MTCGKDQIAEAVASVELVASRIESSFAEVGSQLGRGHTIFQGLNEALTGLSRELSCAQIETASTALRDIAGRLNTLADALPAETALLDRLRPVVAEAGALLKQLSKQVAMIMIIARSAKIESASFDGDRENFVAFTQEAYQLGQAVQRAIEGCARDQELLGRAVETAWSRQTDFERRHRDQLGEASADLMSAFADLNRQRDDSVHVAELAATSVRNISGAVGGAIISLQTGDSTRQRLEHIGDALRRATGHPPPLAPATAEGGAAVDLVVQLQAEQLQDAHQEFDSGIGEVVGALSAIVTDVTGLIEHGRSLHGGREDDSSSFLARVRLALTRASALIATCEDGGRAIDDALSVVEDTLAKFGDAIASLSDSVIDITLIGMNAGLRAAHLGNKGRAFVVIANELKITADQMAAGASRLGPLLTDVEKVAGELRSVRVRNDPAQLTSMEATIFQALREVEAGNERLDRLIDRLVEEGAAFDAVMISARRRMTELDAGVAALPSAVQRLEAGAAAPARSAWEADDEAVFEELYARYTMERERDVHRGFLKRHGVAITAPDTVASDCDFELF